MSKRFDFMAAALFLSLSFSCSLLSFEELQTNLSVAEKQNYYEGDYVTIDFSMDMNKNIAENLISIKEDGKAQEKETIWRQQRFLSVRAAGGFKKGCKYNFTINGALLTSDGRSYEVQIDREFIFGNAEEVFLIESAEEPKENARAPLSLVFNKPINPASFERAFSLTPSIEAAKKYSADKRRVELAPKDKWSANIFYTWKVQDAFSADGVKICKDYSGSFMAMQKAASPKAICVCPVLESGVFLEGAGLENLLERQSLGIIFDSEMNFESVKNGVNFTPQVEGFWNKIDEKRFVFSPAKNYKIQTEYLLEVSGAVEDANGIRVLQSQNYRFKTSQEYITLSAFCINKSAGSYESIELKKDCVNRVKIGKKSPLCVLLRFSKALDEKSIGRIKNAASLSTLFPLNASSPNLDEIQINESAFTEARLDWSGFDFSNDEEEIIYKLKINGGSNFIFDKFEECLKEDECFYISIAKSQDD